MGDVQRKSKELFGASFSLHSAVPESSCLQLHREGIHPGSEYGIRHIRAGTAPWCKCKPALSLPQTFWGSGKPGRKGIPPCRGWLHRGSRAAAVDWADGQRMGLDGARVQLLSVHPHTHGALTVATNGVVFQTLLFTFKMMKLSSHSY